MAILAIYLVVSRTLPKSLQTLGLTEIGYQTGFLASINKKHPQRATTDYRQFNNLKTTSCKLQNLEVLLSE